MLTRILVVSLGLLVSTSHAADLLSTLRNSSITLFADAIESDPELSTIFLSPNVHTVFAPLDSVFASIPPSRRSLVLRQEDDQSKKAQESYHCAKERSDASSERSVPRGRTLESGSDKVPSKRGGNQGQAIVEDNGLDEGGGEGNQRRQAGSPPTLKLFTGNGNSVTVQGPRIEYDGGSIYIIDGLFTVPTNLSTTLASRPDTATFGTILKSSNLTSTLESAVGSTFFIPSNTALAGNQSLTADTIQDHVVPGFAGYLPALRNGQTLPTLSGKALTINITNGEYYINGAKIVSSNLILENGVAHVIDKIITQDSSPTQPPPAEYTGGASTFRDPLRSAGAAVFGAVLAATFMI